MTPFLKKIEQPYRYKISGAFRGMFFTLFGAFYLLCTSIVLAQITSLTDEELATINAQNVRAVKTSGAMETKLQCFVIQDSAYEKRSRVLEQQTGDLHHQAEELRRETDIAKAEEQGFARQSAEIQQQVAASQAQMANLKRSLALKEESLKKCKKDAWIFGFGCDWVGEITGLKGDIRNLKAHHQAATIRLNSIKAQSQAASARLAQASARYEAAQSALSQNQAAISSNEAELASIKSALSTLRSTSFGYAATQSNFDAAYEDFNDLDPNSDHRFVIRALRAASADMAIALPIAEAAIYDGGLLLPSGTRICAG
jgi:DNA repair exonuclease SbcCD ATPase subunit